MVAWYATFLCANQRLVKRKQDFVQLKYIVISVYNKILYDHVKFTAVRKSKASPADKILCLIDIQLQSEGKSQRRCLGWLVVLIIADF